jgi:hypothetical protein
MSKKSSGFAALGIAFAFGDFLIVWMRHRGKDAPSFSRDDAI